MEHIKPISINIETISICNLDCLFCAYKKRKDKQIMNMNTFSKLVKRLIEYDINNVRLTPMTGEIFLDWLLFERLNIFDKFNIRFSFFTNFVEFNPKIFEYKTLDRIHISLNGHDMNSFCSLTNGSTAQYEKLLSNLEYLIQNDLGNKISIVIKDQDFPFNLKNKYFKELWRYICRLKDCTISKMEILDNWAGEITDFPLYKHLIVSQKPRDSFCRVLLEKNIVLWDGSFLACGCRDIDKQTKLGDIFEYSFKEMYESEKYLNMLEIQPEICSKCSARIFNE